MMSSASKSNQGIIANQFNLVPEPKKKRGQAMDPTPNWLELPSDIMANILNRVGVYDIIENAQNVCTAWSQICKDPAMWRIINIDKVSCPEDSFDDIFLEAVQLSQGQLVDITIVGYGHELMLLHIADSSSQLRRLTIACCDDNMCDAWTTALKKFPLLEELSLYSTEITIEAIETVGRYCPLLKTLKLNRKPPRKAPVLNSSGGFYEIPPDDSSSDDDDYDDEIALAIGKNLSGLRDLELIGSSLSNIGLRAILDGCCHLESLDLRKCLLVNLNKGNMEKRCLQQIKYLKRPDDSLQGCPYIYENNDDDHN